MVVRGNLEIIIARLGERSRGHELPELRVDLFAWGHIFVEAYDSLWSRVNMSAALVNTI